MTIRRPLITPGKVYSLSMGASRSYLREDASRSIVCLNDDMLVELSGIHAQRRVEGISLMIIQVHGDIYRQAKELAPLTGLPVIDHC